MGPAVFFLDDDAIDRMESVRLRLEKVLNRVISPDEDIFDTFSELLDQLESVVTEENSTPIHWNEVSTEVPAVED